MRHTRYRHRPRRRPRPAPGPRRSLLTAETLVAAGYPPQHVGELLDYLAGMRPGARRRMEKLLADFLLSDT